MLECGLCRKAPRSCWRWTLMGRILSRLPHTTWRRIRTRRPLPVRSRLSIDARSCAKPVQKKTKALARRLGTPVLEGFLAFYRLVEKKCAQLLPANRAADADLCSLGLRVYRPRGARLPRPAWRDYLALCR